MTHEALPSYQPYATKAKTAFDDLLSSFVSECGQLDSKGESYSANFWQLGCVFDTLLDYLWVMDFVGEPADAKDVSKTIDAAKAGYMNGIIANMAVWYDDYSWYGIASTKAFDPQYEKFFGNELEFFRNIALDTWGMVNAGDFETLANRIPDANWTAAKSWPYKQGKPRNIPKDYLISRGQYHHGTPKSFTQYAADFDPKTYFKKHPHYWKDSDPGYFRAQNQQYAVPRFDGGNWQYDLFSEKMGERVTKDGLTYGTNCYDGASWSTPQPGRAKLGPFQLTLMTGLYWVFASRLGLAAKAVASGDVKCNSAMRSRLGNAKDYQTCAATASQFFHDWAGVEEGSHSLLKTVGEGGCLLRERMPTFAASNMPKADFNNWFGDYPVDELYSADRFWTGDQGLILGGLMSYLDLTGTGADLRSRAEAILGAAATLGSKGGLSATQETGGAKIVQPYSPVEDGMEFTPEFPHGYDGLFALDPGDYGSGSGIFWRYVLHACRTDSEFRTQAVSMLKTQNNAILGSADNEGAGNIGSGIFYDFNVIAVEIVAAYLLKEAAGHES